MINLFKSNEGFATSIFTGLIENGVEQIPAELDGKLLKVDEETYQKLIDHKLMWQNGELVDNPNYSEYVTEQEVKSQKREYRKELREIQQWFKDNDWKVNKIITGEWTEDDPRWVEYKQERTIKRDRQDYLNLALS